MIADIIAILACAAIVLWCIWSRQAVLDRVTASEQARTALDRRPDDTPPVVKAKVWTGVDR